MNKSDRTELEKAVDYLEKARNIIDLISEAEMNKYDNLSEGLQATEKGQSYETNADELSDTSSEIESIISNLCDIISK